MSYGFQFTGSKRAVLVELNKRHDYESAHSIAIKEAAVKLLDGAPDDATVAIESGGQHHYAHDNPYGIVDLRFRVTAHLPEPPVEVPVEDGPTANT